MNAQPSPRSPVLDDLSSDARHLSHLIDTILDQIFSHDRSDPEITDRIDALLWIARDHAQSLAKRMGDL